ncbi:MAG: carbohydrate-binding domain-containing protein [Bacteroidales bacterium]|nr:carbohydrate-binding domain-containing protein [Bacteroidales bacterium]
MSKRVFAVLFIFIFIFSTFSACKKYYASDSPADENEQTDEGSGSESADDYFWNSSEVIEILLNGTSITENSDAVTVDGSKVTIISAGTYSLKGSLTDGQVIVNSKEEGSVRLILNGVNIKCSSSAPIYVKNAGKVLLVLPDNTENFITDGTSYTVDDEGEPNAAVFSKSYLSFYGKGSLTVKANYLDGITGKDGLVIKSGTINVTSADDGIRGKDYLIIRNGNITVTSKGDGLKSDNEDETSLGYITVDSAVVNINSTCDGINAQTDLTLTDGSFNITTGGGAGSAGTTTTTAGFGDPGGGGSTGGYSGTISKKALKAKNNLTIRKGTFDINAADDAIHSNNIVAINGGLFSVATGDDAVHAETSVTIDGGMLDITKCYEGIESATITIKSGDVIIVSTDDGFNATKGSATERNDGSCLYLNGGNVYVNSSTGDGLDSNGSISMTGGTVVVQGPKSAPEVAFDFNGTFNISGGEFIASGPNSGNMIQTPGTTSSQYIVKATTSTALAASAIFHVQDAGGKDIFTFKSERSVYYVVFSSANLINGSTYSIYTGGSSTGTFTKGLYSGGAYTGGTLKKSFSISGKVTSVSF